MARVLASVTLDAPSSDPNKKEGDSFPMTIHYSTTGVGKPPTVNLYWEYRYNATFYSIPVADGLYTDDNEEEGASRDAQYSRTIQCNTQGAYHVRARAYDFTNSIEKVSGEQVVTVSVAKVTQYLAGLDCPEFPHEMDLMSDKLPCPLPYD